ncbi:hypothetical protein [Bythopirellula goksoeyrii]|uniref:Uncharacterized protein n=1 Tax=Bythopirellula goksoeyrii TaxID=1400387 RepID=A0A5B9QQ34_9BACT|nr:hypothetical protein [Bythopirellula goksoeyrii]QEG36241.1 hypothetical protein Pr1d_35530 [Bythopirellula goksoeyrii]
MSLQVIIPDDNAKKVLERSKATGTAPEAIVIGAVREAFTKSGITEAELSELLEKENTPSA